MTIPRIEIKENDPTCLVLHCTGCGEDFYYADYLTEDPEQFLADSKADAARHDCFLAGRVGYVVSPALDQLEDNAFFTHKRDSEGRCLACLRHGEKVRLIEQAQQATGWRREVLLERIRGDEVS
ncbi:hypothetical protein LCGC14_2960340 [marine sediment metagenome]|uniref:Uncharacterized protein n=1 Tax=marine sediment metagenome TaxID=412755 RepID=A0A0F8XCA0_9ZZZZ